MARVIAIYQGGRAGPAVRNDRFVAVVSLIQERGLLDRPLLTPRCRDYDHAEETRKAIYLAARYFCSCGSRLCTRKYSNLPSERNPQGGCPVGGQRLSCRADIVKDKDGRLRVQATFFDKKEATREIIRKYGPDPDKWPYNPRAKRMRA